MLDLTNSGTLVSQDVPAALQRRVVSKIEQGDENSLTKKEAEKLEFRARPNSGNARNWQMSVCSDVARGFSKPSDAVVWCNEVDDLNVDYWPVFWWRRVFRCES